MQPRHLALLQTRLERVLEIGAAEITNVELATWFNADRVGVNSWRAIHAQWLDLIENTKHVSEKDKRVKLLVGDANGTWVFVFGRGLQTHANSWLKDIREGSKIPFNADDWADE